MNQISERQRRGVLNAGKHVLLTAGAVCLIGAAALAQDNGPAGNSGYQVGEKPQATQDDKSAPADKQTPVETKRLARIDYISGNVTWRPNDSADWKKAKNNLSLNQGGQIWVSDGGRAEIRFDDGSLLRLGNGSIVTLQTVYGDTEGDYTQIKMVSGVITVKPKLEKSVFQVDTPFNSVKMSGPARVRVGVGADVEVGVRMGKATVEGKPGKTVVHAGSFLTARDANASYAIVNLPAEDSWERWNDERDHLTYPHSGYGPYYAPYYAPAPPFFLGLSFGGGYWGHGGWRR